MVAVKPIRTEADYDAAVARIGELMDAAPGTPEGEELDLLGDLVILGSARAFGEGANPTKLDTFPIRWHVSEPRDAGGAVGGVGE